MKKLIEYIMLMSCVLPFASCEDTDYQVYDRNQKDRLYFFQDTVRFEYGLRKDEKVDLAVQVGLVGFIDLGRPRNLEIEIVDERTDAVQGTHFDLKTVNPLLQDSCICHIPVDFFKSNMEKNKEYALCIRILENKEFLPTDIKECLIFFTNMDIEAPVWWRSQQLGEYNQEKLILFVDYFHQAKEKSPVIYASIEATWGENLDEGDRTNLLTIYKYQGFLERYILTPMYDYYMTTGDPVYQIPKPN